MKPGQLSDKEKQPKVAVVQDGARLHYAIPISLQRAGALSVMFSDAFFRRGWRTSLVSAVAHRLSPRRFQSLFQRRADEIPAGIVRTNFSLAVRQARAKRRFSTDEAFYQQYSQAVGDWVLNRGIGSANTLYGYVRNIDPRLCREFRSRGILTVADQIIAPAAIESVESQIQQKRWPEWVTPQRQSDHALVQQVEQSTWSELDLITCGSQYVCDGLISQGIPRERIEILPYPIDTRKYPVRAASHSSQKITIGFLGAVGLRKGIPYFLEIAKRLKSEQLRFVLVGPVHLPESIARQLTESVELIGHVPRAQTIDWLQKFDMLLFPSTCEGNAGAVSEAMACGLPVVASPNSGTSVRDGIQGFIRRYDDIDGLAACVDKLATDSALRKQMSIAARATAEGLNLDHYGQQLVGRMTQALSAKQ